MRRMTCALACICAGILYAVLVCGCSPSESQQGASAITEDASTMVDVTDQSEQQAVDAAAAKVRALGRAPRIVATSPAVIEICDKLGLDLVGICSSSLHEAPARYKDLPQVGTAMSPDMEKVGSLDPDWILSPDSLASDLKPKYEALGADYAFCNLNSVQGMYRSIQELGTIFGCSEAAEKLTADFTTFYSSFQKENAAKKRPRVLILMGMPGSYVIATKNSYVGNLVELAGGENVYDDEDQDFLTVNTEDMKSKEPDIILRAAHAMPEQVSKMFADEFKTNDIWRHFDAVENGRVYDLPYETFGMSATFEYQEALGQLQELLYGNTGSGTGKEGPDNGK